MSYLRILGTMLVLAGGPQLTPPAHAAQLPVVVPIMQKDFPDTPGNEMLVLTVEYKPAPQVYRMVAQEMNVQTGAIRLVSVHLGDNLGAQNAGCSSALVARPGNAPPPALSLPGWPAPAAAGPDLPSVAA